MELKPVTLSHAHGSIFYHQLDTQKNQARCAVVGAGPVGLLTAYQLLGMGAQVDIYDPLLAHYAQKSFGHEQDMRYISLNYGSVMHMLNTGLDIRPHAQAIESVDIHIHQHWGKCQMRAQDYHVPALAYAIHYRHLCQFLYQALLPFLENKQLTVYAKTFSMPDDSSANIYDYDHLWLCDGMLQQDLHHKDDYQQYAHIGFAQLKPNPAYVNHTHIPTALERFTPEGPIAVLPYQAYSNRLHAYATHVVVWCTAINMPQADTNILQTMLRGQYHIQHIDWQQSVRLYGHHQHPDHQKNMTHLGNRLQALHPVAGQGLNLAIRQLMRATQAWFAWYAQGEARAQAPFFAHDLHDECDRMLMYLNTKLMAKGFAHAPLRPLLSAALGLIGGQNIFKAWVAKYFMYGL